MYDEWLTVRVPSSLGAKALRFYHEHMYAIAASWIPGLEKQDLFEVGPGRGQIAERHRGKYRAQDANEKFCEVMRARGLDVVCGTVPPIRASEPADVIWLSHVLEHVLNFIEGWQLLKSAYDNLKPGGHLVVICPDILSAGALFYEEWTHGFPTSRTRVEHMLSDVGFEIVMNRYHVATVTNPVLSFFLYQAFRLFPYNVIDFLTTWATGRPFAFNFWSYFGTRQLYFIARRPVR
jgi:SAM-dependent methyltransferase